MRSDSYDGVAFADAPGAVEDNDPEGGEVLGPAAQPVRNTAPAPSQTITFTSEVRADTLVCSPGYAILAQAITGRMSGRFTSRMGRPVR